MAFGDWPVAKLSKLRLDDRRLYVKDRRAAGGSPDRTRRRPGSPRRFPSFASSAKALWERVKLPQSEIDADPKVQAMKASRFWEHRRPMHLLTRLVRCAHCGGDMASVGRDYLACANARKLGRCDQRKSIRRAVLEEFVLDLIRDAGGSAPCQSKLSNEELTPLRPPQPPRTPLDSRRHCGANPAVRHTQRARWPNASALSCRLGNCR